MTLGATALSAGNVLLLLLQIVVILLVARVAATAFRHLGQPSVVGEMIGGLLLGPSVFGVLAPTLFLWLFHADSLRLLRAVSQIGILVFMFVVGTEFDIATLQPQARTAVAVALVGLIVPLALGAVLAVPLYGIVRPPVHLTPFVLFVGIAMSVTAFPVLARIVTERGLLAQPVGQLVLASAAIDDATAWCLLAVAVSIATTSTLSETLASIGVGAVFTIAMIGGARSLIARVRPRRTTWVTPLAAGTWLTSMLVTAACGFHAVFGAFIAGVTFSDNPQLRATLRRRIEGVGSSVLVPLFFAFAGLRTEVSGLAYPRDWLIGAGVIALAIAAKLGACAAAAQWSGLPRRDALAVGALMNTRGLMELIVLDIGYDLGVFTPNLFAILVIMAIITTCMTGPIVSRLQQSPQPFTGPTLGTRL
jgi:Kef-type K+ transport system membrane component KefB